jgi:hypothetical protein
MATTLPRSPVLELDPMKSAEPQTMAAWHEQQPQRPMEAFDIPSATVEIGYDMRQPYWRAFTMQMDTAIKANCTAQVIPIAHAIAEQVLRQQ